MDYVIDMKWNLTKIHQDFNGNLLAIRRALLGIGLSPVDSHQMSMFSVYGFHTPHEIQTLNTRNKLRLSVITGSHQPLNERPTAWNRPNKTR